MMLDSISVFTENKCRTEAVVPPNPRAVGDIILSAKVAVPRSIWLLGALDRL